MKRVSLAVVLALALSPTPAFAQTTPTYGESQIGKTGCVPNNNDADFDTIAQCDASSGTGTFQKAPLFIGAVSSPPYASTSCSSSMAGMIQYTGSVFEGCNGTAWSQFESSSGTLTFPVGSVSAPGLAVTTDTSTGLFQATTGTISFATEGVEALRLLNTTSAVDYLTVQPGITGSPGTVTVGAGGSDSNINIALTPKGSGGVNVTSGAVTLTSGALTFTSSGEVINAGGRSALVYYPYPGSTLLLGWNSAGGCGTALTTLASAIGVTGIGMGAICKQTGNYNTALGNGALANVGTGNYNTAVGFDAMFQVGTVSGNTAVGPYALANVSGGGNTAVGYQTGGTCCAGISSGSNNSIFGFDVASSTLTTGSGNILIGTSSAVDTPSSSTSNFLDIGNTIFGVNMAGTVSSPAGQALIDSTTDNGTGATFYSLASSSTGYGGYFTDTAGHGTNYALAAVDTSTGTGYGGYFSETGANNTGYAVYGLNNSSSGWGEYQAGTAPSYFAGNVGIGTSSPTSGAALDLGSNTNSLLLPKGTTSQAPSSPVAGMMRWNSTDTAVEVYNGSSWVEFVVETPGSTANVTASGPPVNANIYTPSNVTCNFTPGYGSCSNIDDGVWPANGGNDASNSSCVNLPISSTDSIIYDLGTAQTINNVYISMDSYDAYMLAGISFSTDGVNYTNSVSFGYNSGNAEIEYIATALNPNVTARYVRLTNGGSASSTHNTVCQFAVGP